MRVFKKSCETQITCPKCNAELIYGSEDIHLVGDMESDWDYCVICPECGKNIKVL
jgi:hypothetical protein